MNVGRPYSYGDMLKKPHWYDMICRLWNYGSINLFLWADPDYCARFSKSMRRGDGSGFEINSPLSLKRTLFRPGLRCDSLPFRR
jgi:hypothetical protein